VYLCNFVHFPYLNREKKKKKKKKRIEKKEKGSGNKKWGPDSDGDPNQLPFGSL